MGPSNARKEFDRFQFDDLWTTEKYDNRKEDHVNIKVVSEFLYRLKLAYLPL